MNKKEEQSNGTLHACLKIWIRIIYGTLINGKFGKTKAADYLPVPPSQDTLYVTTKYYGRSEYKYKWLPLKKKAQYTTMEPIHIQSMHTNIIQGTHEELGHPS